ncbi:hypothetical protein [Rathayibacter toxicus]|uniref:hypothetical protein n=1 Tax=Rathayibacter toxicus TaxID=145458 RepID=UPI001C05756A|nr:hypothetical protein [Rathayibacter toxicus]QWL30917.1 hypothetical protein E2R34_09300 [Rathayibacter toxicus]
MKSTVIKSFLSAGFAAVALAGIATPAYASPAKSEHPEKLPAICEHKLAPSATMADGVPGPLYYRLLQCYAADGGYKGPIDGDLGNRSWVGVEKHLKEQGLYKSDKFPGEQDPETTRGLERFGIKFGGGRGTVNGFLNADDYRDIAQALNHMYAK